MARRSCDVCVRRKTRCDNEQPCRKCTEAKEPLGCTYLNPVLKRGPKAPRRGRHVAKEPPPIAKRITPDVRQPTQLHPNSAEYFLDDSRASTLQLSVLLPIVDIYKRRMYPVWPVVDAQALIARLKAVEETVRDGGVYILATALCAATIAQLKLDAADERAQKAGAQAMEHECTRLRNASNYREHPSMDNVLASFFLHVYHAKIDNRNAAMMFLQESIYFARMLGFDDSSWAVSPPGQDPAKHGLIYLLLWVSERGYALQHNMPVSIQETVKLPAVREDIFDVHERGLIELASLFVTFDVFSLQKDGPIEYPETTSGRLLQAQHTLARQKPNIANYDLVQHADYQITRHWMQILLWQKSMKQGLLSSAATVEAMMFNYPSTVAKELLSSIAAMSGDHLAPLGRDQMVKSFEITNTLADVVLCSAAFVEVEPSSTSASWRGGLRRPSDFLHDLFQTISPFLKQDRVLDGVLRQKVGEALWKPSRVRAVFVTASGEEHEDASEVSVLQAGKSLAA